MTRPNVEATLAVRHLDGGPVIEARARPIAGGSPIPRGKLLVVRTPILPPGSSEARTRAGVQALLLDDEGDPFVGLCWTARFDAANAKGLIALFPGASVARSIGPTRRDRNHATFI